MKLFILIFTVISFFSITLAQTTNYYVDNHLGIDTLANGTAPDSLAWKTVAYAVSHVANPTTDSIIINISAGTYNLASNEIDINRSFLNLTLIGAGIDTTIVEADSNLTVSKSRVFEILGGNNVTIERMTIQNGKVSNSGGGILNSSGTLKINYCKIYNNYSGSIGYGGGIANISGNLTIDNTTIDNNNAPDTCLGGGIGTIDGITNVNNSTISNNSSVSGGGIAIIAYSSNTLFNITNSTISQNVATYHCGGIRISNYDKTNTFKVTVNINSCTIFDDSCTSIYGIGGIGVLNDSQYVNIKNSIISGNVASKYSDMRGSIISGGYNLIQDTTLAKITGNTTTNIYDSSAYCQPLALNNSKNGTMTCAIPDSSPAKNKIPVDSSNGAPLLDQRGATRNGNFDIGAYEFWDNNGALPVELSSFIASADENNVNLKWTTATEINNRGFQIEKNSGSGFVPLAFVSGHGTSTQLNTYSYTDKNVSGGVYSYRLKQVDYDGSYKYSQAIKVNLFGPNNFALSQNYPNPFNPTTTIKFALPSAERVRVIVYNQLGQEVAQVADRNFEAGNHSIQFIGSNLASGVYFYRIQAGTFSQVKKMILMK